MEMATLEAQLEKRNFSRISFGREVLIRTDDSTIVGKLVNISLKGFLAEFSIKWQPETNAIFCAEIELAGKEVMVNMQAKVRHQRGQVIGFSCESIDLESISHLRRLVELNLGDEALLGQELLALGR